MITALAHLEISHVRQITAVQADTRMLQHRITAQNTAARELLYQSIGFRRTKKQVDLWKRFLQRALVALDHAADCDDSTAHAARLVLTRLDQRVERLLFRGVDEAAGVDDDDVGVGHVGGVFGAAVGELGDVPLAVDGVLVAAEGDDGDFEHG